MSLTLAGCGEAHLAASPNERKPIVRIPMTCELMAAPVAAEYPKEGQDGKDKMFEYWDLIEAANGNLKATKECQSRQRKRFAKG